jgi:hypothetical protein
MACESFVQEYFDWAEQQTKSGPTGVAELSVTGTLPLYPLVEAARFSLLLKYQSASITASATFGHLK